MHLMRKMHSNKERDVLASMEGSWNKNEGHRILTGYCVLIIDGKTPTYRIVFKRSLPEALKATPKIKAETQGRVEVLRMVDGDTKLEREDITNEYIED